MNKLKGTLMLALAFFLTLSLFAPAAKAAEASPLDLYFPADIEEHWAYPELDNFINADLLKGYVEADGTVKVKPNNPISRAEFVAILVRVLDLRADGEGKTFADVEAGKWYTEPVRIASELGIVNGVSDTKFGTNQSITRGEIATLVVRAFESSVVFAGDAKTFTDVPNYFAAPFIEKASRAGIVQGSTATTFQPFANAKRAEAVVMIQRALDLQKNDLPEDSALTQIILDVEAQELELINKKAFDQLAAFYAKSHTGYYQALSAAYAEDLTALVGEGYSLQMERATEQKLTVLDKTERFAVVESTGGSYRVTTTDAAGTEPVTETQSNAGVYLLKKMADGGWKIYAYYENE
ncbi:S-layer homology domain-containing protein [Paenibacillus sp. NPDC058071]|uniref:S-layer homology domain-containing protein n=1 Tax=Paenibacillus sp. NPDC058071 TaxID=3346326 RepID=UPI0036DCCF57